MQDTKDTSALAFHAACFRLTVAIEGLHGLNVHSVEDVVLSGSGPVEPSTALHLQLHSFVTALAARPAMGKAHCITLFLHAKVLSTLLYQ